MARRAAQKVGIPIRNIYYLLCYAWNSLEEAELVDAGRIESTDLLGLFARVLCSGTTYLLRRGMDRGYREKVDATSSLRGRIDFEQSLKENLFASARAYCVHDDFTHDVLHNQIIGATISKLVSSLKLDSELRDELWSVYKRIQPLSNIPLRGDIFHRVQLHHQRSMYKFLLNVCQLISEGLLPEEENKTNRFRDFTRNRRTMAKLFENFVLRFYERHHIEFEVSVDGGIKARDFG